MILLPLPKICPTGGFSKLEYDLMENKSSTPGTLPRLSFVANITALACSAAFPKIGIKTAFTNANGIFYATDAP